MATEYDWTFNKYRRNAMPSERVWFYPNVVPSDKRDNCPQRVVAFVQSANGQVANLRVIGRSRFYVVDSARHIDDPYWEGRLHLLPKQGKGCWDFIPADARIFNEDIRIENAKAASKALREEKKTAMPDKEFEALEALERHGPDIARICADIGVTNEAVKKLDSFMAQYRLLKTEAWHKKEDAELAKKKARATKKSPAKKTPEPAGA